MNLNVSLTIQFNFNFNSGSLNYMRDSTEGDIHSFEQEKERDRRLYKKHRSLDKGYITRASSGSHSTFNCHSIDFGLQIESTSVYNYEYIISLN